MSVLDELLVRTLIQVMFEFTKTLSMFNVFKLSDSMLLTCKLRVVHPLLLEMYEIFLPCFPIGNVNSITIYFTF